MPLAIDAGSTLSEHDLAIFLGAIGLVIVFSGLVSGIVERGPISLVIVFVLLGVLVGPHVLDVIDLGIESPAIQAAGTISLILIFFTDAIEINLGQLRRDWLLPAIALGPGAILTILFLAASAFGLFDLPWDLTFLIATVLASTDAILLRDVVNNRHLPRSVRHTLRIEAGTNDVIILPLLLVLSTIAANETRSGVSWIRFGINLYVVGPLVGVAIAYGAIRAMSFLRRRRLIRRDYESIYSIGVAFLSYAAAQAVGGSGFIAAFAAGLTIAIMDEELCDCFLEYGQTTAEMTMLLTFVLLGSALMDAAWNAFDAATFLFALVAIVIARPLAFVIALMRADASRSAKLMLAWFGPRGLNSLLLMLIAVAAGVPQSTELFGIVAVVVVVSTLVHGISATPFLNWYGRRLAASELPEEVAESAAVLLRAGDHHEDSEAIPRLLPADLKAMLDRSDPVTVIDVRRAAAVESSGRQIPSSLRIPIDELLERIEVIPRDRPVLLSCA